MERAKQQESEEIAKKMAAFLAGGGKLYQAAPGETADKECNGFSGVSSNNVKRGEDLSGKRFGNLLVLHRSKDRTLQMYWMCRCDCGVEQLIEKAPMIKGRITNCSKCRAKDKKPKITKKALAAKISNKNKGKDLTGRRFGKLVANEIYQNSTDGKRRWLCVCDCGNKKAVVTSKLINGHTKTCGECTR